MHSCGRQQRSVAAATPPSTFTYHFTRISRNAKTGPIPVTTTSANSCPPGCSLKGNGCYAESGPLALHWRAVSDGQRGGSFDELLQDISTIDVRLLTRLAIVNRGRRGFTYTHYPPTSGNGAAIQRANELGFTVNLSAQTLAQADGYSDLGIAPVVVILPASTDKPARTPAGRHVVVCPASLGSTDCLNCGICQQRDRSAIVGFPAHGAGAKKVQAVFFGQASS
jgi:hypothetical protein